MKFRLSLLPAALVLASVPASADIVHLDDVIIDGSLCVGFDCVNGEAFGFDTIRLKENNVRIKFQDTSSSASFPTNDWQLTANDSSNGGANKFSIDDIDGSRTPFTLEAGARTNALYVESDGDVGFGTNNPAVNLHVVDGNTPTLRLEQDGSSGFSPQTWDVAGNETNFFIRDATNGSQLPFRIFPNAGTSLLNLKSKSIGINETSPTSTLTVKNTDTTATRRDMLTLSNLGASNLIFNNRDTGTDWRINTTSVDRFVFTQQGAGAEGQMVLEDNGPNGIYLGIGDINPNHPIEHLSGAHLTTGGVWTNASSRTLKKDIREIQSSEAVEALDDLTPVTYVYKSEPDERYAGFIAEDVPEIVAQNDRKSLSTMDIVAVLTKAVKEQQKNIQSLQERLDTLESSR